jgi:hypothetical protein
MEIGEPRPSPRPWWENLGIRVGAWRRRIGAERQIGRTASGLRRDLRAARRDAKTSVAVGRARFTAAVARSLEEKIARPDSAGD